MRLLALAARVAREGSIVVATLIAFTAGSVAYAVPAGMDGNRPKAHDASDLGVGVLGVGAGALLVHGGIALAAGAGLAVGGGVVLGVVGVAAIGYGGYRLYKFFTKKDAAPIIAPRPTAPGGVLSPGRIGVPGSNIGRGSDTRPTTTTTTTAPTTTTTTPVNSQPHGRITPIGRGGAIGGGAGGHGVHR